jgi:hypothetical protein
MKLINIISTVVVFFLLVWLISVLTTPRVKAHQRCSDFATQADAQQAYRLGATYLDRTHNGVACKSLLKRH